MYAYTNTHKIIKTILKFVKPRKSILEAEGKMMQEVFPDLWALTFSLLIA